jgi:hypothetical protein
MRMAVYMDMTLSRRVGRRQVGRVGQEGQEGREGQEGQISSRLGLRARQRAFRLLQLVSRLLPCASRLRFPFTGAFEIGLGLLDGRLAAPCGGSLLLFLRARRRSGALFSGDLFLGRGSRRSPFSGRWLWRRGFGATRLRCRRAGLQRNSRQHLETAWLERLREATKWLGRFGRKRQRFERPH